MTSEPATTPNEEQAEFEIDKEVWNIYVLEDGSKIKARSILTRLFVSKESENGEGAKTITAFFSNIIAAYSPESLRGIPNPRPLSPSEAVKRPQAEVKILERDEGWNSYVIVGRNLKVKTKMVANSIQRVIDEYNDDGTPYYFFKSSVVTEIAPDK